MDEMDMIFLYKEFLDDVDLSFLEGADRKEKEEEEMKEDE